MKVTVKISADGRTYEVFKGREYIGAGSIYAGGKCTFGHVCGAGWAITVTEATPAAIAAELTNEHNDLYIL